MGAAQSLKLAPVDASEMKLAVLGDSMAQGLTNGAVRRPEWSYPAIIARTCGLEVTTHRKRENDFVVPSFSPPGLPMDIEALLREAERYVGSTLRSPTEVLQFLCFIVGYFDRVEAQYERSGPPGDADEGPPNHLAIAGTSVRECRDLTASECDELITADPGSYADNFAAMASRPLYRIARHVVNASGARQRQAWSSVRCLQELVAKNRANVLILHPGNADILDAVVELELRVMPGDFRGDRKKREDYNVTHPHVFEKDFEDLVESICRFWPKEFPIFVGTLPRSTAAPFIRGLGKQDEDGYYDAYGHFFVPRRMYGPFAPRILSKDDAKLLDEIILDYNARIKKVVGQRKQFKFHVVDVHDMVLSLAVHQNRDPAEPLHNYVGRYKGESRGLERLLALEPVPDARGYRIGEDRRRIAGGLFGLDGGHPSTVGYGLVADLFLRKMREEINGIDRDVEWVALVAQDACIARGPSLWRELLALAEAHPRIFAFLFNRQRTVKASVGAKAQSKRVVSVRSLPGRRNLLQPG